MRNNRDEREIAADEDLERRVFSHLSAQHQPAMRSVRVKALHGTVLLRGQVNTFYEKQLSQSRAQRVAGVVRVIDEVEVLGAPPPALVKARTLVWGTALLALSAGILSGCSKSIDDQLPVFPVKGQIRYGTKLLPGAFVIFHPQSGTPDAPHPTARVAQDGSFTLSTYAKDDGAPAGDYAITVQWQRPLVMGSDVTFLNVLPAQLNLPQTSGLRATVDRAQNELPSINVAAALGGQQK